MPEFDFYPAKVITHEYLGGVQYLFQFLNGYGASVIRHRGSYGFDLGLWELGLIEWDGEEWELIYNDDFVDVLGWLNENDVNRKLHHIASYSV